MGNLVLNSLEIKNFRAFRHLRIERLGRVNLITGKNNVGKTTLLEALYLYARGASPNQLVEFLDARDELRDPQGKNGVTQPSLNTETHWPEVSALFYGRKKLEETSEDITIGPLDTDDYVGLAIRWLRWPNAPALPRSWYGWVQHLTDTQSMTYPIAPYMGTKYRQDLKFYTYPLDSLSNARNLAVSSSSNIPCMFLRMSGGSQFNVSSIWDKIALTSEEDTVIEALKIISPDIVRVGMIGEEDGNQKRIPLVRRSGSPSPLPMRSLGDGVNRWFELILALISAENGFLLIDEMEHGLHYSVQSEIWKCIFNIAHRLNVQVFATTHSWDCVEAFQEAAKADEHEEALLIRLVEQQEDVVIALFDEHELDIATRHMVEVR
jgi:predicted ATPase